MSMQTRQARREEAGQHWQRRMPKGSKGWKTKVLGHVMDEIDVGKVEACADRPGRRSGLRRGKP